jgi:hypothetical protein
MNVHVCVHKNCCNRVVGQSLTFFVYMTCYIQKILFPLLTSLKKSAFIKTLKYYESYVYEQRGTVTNRYLYFNAEY